MGKAGDQMMWYIIGAVGIVLFLYFIDGFVSTRSLKRMADSAEYRNKIEQQKLNELTRTNKWFRDQVSVETANKAQSKVEKIILDAKKNAQESHIIV